MSTQERVAQACRATLFTGEIHHFESIDSTNRAAMERGREGFTGEVFLADEQTAGRGRGGHSWHSKRGDGLYLSVLLRPRVAVQDVLKISFAAGLAAQRTIGDAIGLDVDIRWPNDLVVPSAGNRKVGGILTETTIAADGSLAFCVIGIGLNLNHPMMPEELQAISVSLRMLTGQPVDRDSLACSLLQHLSEEVVVLEKDAAATTNRFSLKSTWVRGKRVSVAEDGGYTGITEGLSATGLLLVRCDDDRLREVRHGGVREA